MYAKPGDWLVVEGHEVGGAVRHGLIEEVHGSEGAPPYLVHWTDTGHRALFFPSTDAYVLTVEQMRKQELLRRNAIRPCSTCRAHTAPDRDIDGSAHRGTHGQEAS